MTVEQRLAWVPSGLSAAARLHSAHTASVSAGAKVITGSFAFAKNVPGIISPDDFPSGVFVVRACGCFPVFSGCVQTRAAGAGERAGRRMARNSF